MVALNVISRRLIFPHQTLVSDAFLPISCMPMPSPLPNLWTPCRPCHRSLAEQWNLRLTQRYPGHPRRQILCSQLHRQLCQPGSPSLRQHCESPWAMAHGLLWRWKAYRIPSRVHHALHSSASCIDNPRCCVCSTSCYTLDAVFGGWWEVVCCCAFELAAERVAVSWMLCGSQERGGLGYVAWSIDSCISSFFPGMTSRSTIRFSRTLTILIVS